MLTFLSRFFLLSFSAWRRNNANFFFKNRLLYLLQKSFRPNSAHKPFYLFYLFESKSSAGRFDEIHGLMTERGQGVIQEKCQRKSSVVWCANFSVLDQGLPLLINKIFFKKVFCQKQLIFCHKTFFPSGFLSEVFSIF